jgi:hypothetical protein
MVTVTATRSRTDGGCGVQCYLRWVRCSAAAGSWLTAAAQTAKPPPPPHSTLRNHLCRVHTHGGTVELRQASPNDALANGMRAGSLAVACLADVPLHPGRNTAGVPGVPHGGAGELYGTILSASIADEMVTHHGLRRALGIRSRGRMQRQP